MGAIDRYRYYFLRGGLGFVAARIRRNMGFSSDAQFRSTEAYARFCEYFTNLRPEDYAEELKTQFATILSKFPAKYTEKPETFCEKIQWLKVNEISTLKTILADKYLAREWVAEKIGGGHLIPLVGGPWKSAEEICFDSLPDQFVLKANHGSGMNLIVRDKKQINLSEVKKLCDLWMKTLYGWQGMEVQYFGIPRRIIAEKYMENIAGDLYDYKIHCFNGKPELIQYGQGRAQGIQWAFYDTEWNLQNFRNEHFKEIKDPVRRPKQLEEALEIARLLSENFAYVRVDLYLIGDDKIYFGEMTFTSANGEVKWMDAKIEKMFGDKIRLDRIAL